MSRTMRVLAIVLTLCFLPRVPLSAQEGPIRFEDMSDKLGIAPLAKGWQLGHGGAWGDADGDGRPDLYFGAFTNPRDGRDPFSGPDAVLPCLLLLNKPEGFVLTPDRTVLLEGQRPRVSYAAFADLDNDGDLDLISGNHVLNETFSFQTRLYENLGGGKFKDSTPVGDYWPSKLGVRNIGVIDINQDGLLDLLVADGSYGRGTQRLIVLANKGKLEFQDISADLGFPHDKTMGLGLAIGDVNDDGVMDIFVAGDNRLFVSGAGGKYHEVQHGEFELPTAREALACGADFADLNGDGLLDLVTTVHGTPSRIHLYVNEGVRDGDPHFVQVSEKAGVAAPFRTRNTHVELRDVDNDGRVDIMLAILYRVGPAATQPGQAASQAPAVLTSGPAATQPGQAASRTGRSRASGPAPATDGLLQPLVLRNLGNTDGGVAVPVPQFTAAPAEGVVGYYAAAPVADYDRDGRVDMFAVPWSTRTPPCLFRNVSKSGHWLTVNVVGKGPSLNPMGIGSIVRAYKPGMMGKPQGLLARYDIALGNGYSSGEEALAHLGLGAADKVDLLVTWGRFSQEQRGIPVDRLVRVVVEGWK